MLVMCVLDMDWKIISRIANQKRLSSLNKKYIDPDVIRTRSLLIWSQTRYRCATESDNKKLKLIGLQLRVLLMFGLGLLYSKYTKCCNHEAHNIHVRL